MRILSCCPLSYYGMNSKNTLSTDLFVRIPRELGHTVVSFDYISSSIRNREEMNDHFLSLIKGGGFDYVIIETAGEQFFNGVLDSAKKRVPLIAWNSDDDCRWNSYSAKIYNSYSLMYTTSNSVYNALKSDYPNLRHSQWGCTGFTKSHLSRKDANVSFCGSLKDERIKEISEIMQKGRYVHVRGKGSEKFLNSWRELKNILITRMRRGRNSGFRTDLAKWFMARSGISVGSLSYEEMHMMWNKRKIMFSPLNLDYYQIALKEEQYTALGIRKSPDDIYQCKSRIFEQGMSGAIMLTNKTDFVREYYSAGIEYEEYSDIDECIDKMEFYLKNEKSRKIMAKKYMLRTQKNHMWTDRYSHIHKAIKEIM